MQNYNKYIIKKGAYLIMGGIAIATTSLANGQTLMENNVTATNNPHYAHTKTINHPKALVHSTLASHNLITHDGQAVQALRDFLQLYNIKYQNTLPSIQAAMQDNFLQKKEVASEIADTEKDKKVRQQALALLKQMGFTDAIAHEQAAVDYFLLFGSTFVQAEKRFNDLLNQHKSGLIQCGNIVFLSSNRKLHLTELKKIKTVLGVSLKDFLKEISKKEGALTEVDIWRFLWKTKASVALKENFHEKSNLFFIETTDKALHRDATPIAALEYWLKTYNPKPGTCHANVEKPYAIRMEKDVRLVLERHTRTLPKSVTSFSISWNSLAAPTNTRLAIYKDELSRAFTQEYELKKYMDTL